MQKGSGDASSELWIQGVVRENPTWDFKVRLCKPRHGSRTFSRPRPHKARSPKSPKCMHTPLGPHFLKVGWVLAGIHGCTPGEDRKRRFWDLEPLHSEAFNYVFQVVGAGNRAWIWALVENDACLLSAAVL